MAMTSLNCRPLNAGSTSKGHSMGSTRAAVASGPMCTDSASRRCTAAMMVEEERSTAMTCVCVRVCVCVCVRVCVCALKCVHRQCVQKYLHHSKHSTTVNISTAAIIYTHHSKNIIASAAVSVKLSTSLDPCKQWFSP